MPALLEEALVQTEAPAKNYEPAPEAIELRAYFRYVDRGRVDGFALDDWLAAEDDLRQEAEGNS